MRTCFVVPVWLGALLLLTIASARADVAVERGKYLVTVGICGSCHTPNLSGGRKTAGILSANITADKETGIGTWTDEQIIEAIRNGKRPDGAPVRPSMGVFWYKGISDSDMHAIVAYLRTVPPVHTMFERPPVTKLPPDYGPPVSNVADVPRSDELAYGRYIGANIAHCMQCHTPKGANGLPDLTKLGAGGNTYDAPGGGKATSANITPANPDGIATWSDDEIKRAITKGVRPNGTQLIPVMDFDFYDHFTPQDLDALVLFLRSLKPVASDKAN
jgi:mono/diheme cytochrome c family protein